MPLPEASLGDLPEVNATWTLCSSEGRHKLYAFEHDEDPDFLARVLIVAKDLDEGIWTCYVVKAHPRLSWKPGQIVMIVFDENGNWSEWKVRLEDYNL